MFAASKTDSASTGGYQISRSLRFNSADSAYLNRTPATTTNRRTWTWSGWVKRGKIGDWAYLFQGSAGNPTGGLDDGTAIRFSSTNNPLVIYNLYNSASTVEVSTAALFRDPSAWYHIIVAMDTTQATSTDRVKVYVNGVQAALNAGGVYPTLNEDLYVNTTNSHLIGALTRDGGGAQLFNDGYMTEVNFIDGQALTSSSFGETNAQTGVWQPKAYSGSYGTNGFYLNFSDNSNTTAATLGKDYSGNGNNWTPNNFSVTAGAGNDSLVDSPTSYGTDTGVGGTVRGNYGTLNPLFNATTLTNGNLDASLNAISTTGTFGSNASKWYFECTFTSLTGTSYLGIADQTLVKSDSSFSYSQVYVYLSNSQKGGNGGSATYGSSYTTGDVIGVAYDLDSGSITFYKNGTSQGVAYSTGFTAGSFWRPFLYCSATTTATFNFGQRPFAYTAPSGFKALCTQNLPTPTIGATTATQAGKFFNPVTYTGTGSSLSVTGVGFQPDWVWVKGRSGATDHGLYDAVRGVQKQLESNTTGAETTETTGITAFGSDGFTTGALAQLNTSSATYVAWNWKANGAGTTNTAGSITSTVSANTTSGFSVVTYTGTGSAATIGHGLGVAPSMLIFKSRSNGSENWNVYHKSLGASTNILLNSTIAAFTDAAFLNATAPTSTVLSVGGAGSTGTNQSSGTYVCYAFSEVAGYSKFGSYTGNGSTDGPFIYCGFRPAFLMVKRADSTGNWTLLDATRNPANAATGVLYPNLSDAEATSGTGWLFLSNGVKSISTGADWNAGAGTTYIFAAFAQNPFKYSLAR